MGFFNKIFSNADVGTSDPAWHEFYQRFEARFRGSDELIRERYLTRYGEFLRVSVKGGVLLDLGCGRGEFLDLAKSVGFKTQGIELSDAAARITAQKGHPVEQGDLLRFLERQSEQSFQAIVSFHVIEHCPAPYFWRVVREAFRALEPGGMLLIETPSLYSLWVAARQFYLDPTHVRPIHPEYLRFLLEDSGFQRVETRSFDSHLGPERAVLDRGIEGQKLEEWLYGPMDLAVLGYKPH